MTNGQRFEGNNLGGRVGACAYGEAAFQRAAHEGLGVPWIHGDGVAWAAGGAGHPFLFGAVTLHPRPALPAMLRGTVCDSFAALDVGDLPGPGWWVEDGGPWMLRLPAPVPAVSPPGLRISRVTSDANTVVFERTAFLAAAGRPPERAGELHPAGSQRTAGLHMFVAWIDGRPIGTALALEHDHGVLISAVTVLPVARRRGVGTALTIIALQVAPGRSATLSATADGLPLYRRLGFAEVGRQRHWQQSPVPER